MHQCGPSLAGSASLTVEEARLIGARGASALAARLNGARAPRPP